MADLLIERRDSGIAVVTINRPRRRNAISSSLWRELRSTFESFADAQDVRAVILTGAEGHFSAGADISEFSELRADSEMGQVYETDVEACYEAIFSLPKPTVAAVDGYAVGGGCALAMTCDFRVSSPRAAFGIPAARLGIVYSPRECRMLQTLVGIANAKRILFSGDTVPAGRALEIGLVDELSDDDPVAAAAGLLKGMADNAPIAIAGMKLTLNAIAHDRLDDQEASIREITDRAFDSEDYREGAKAFIEKRKPAFVGW